MGIWTPVPWRRVGRKQMLYPLDHDAPHYTTYADNKQFKNIKSTFFFAEQALRKPRHITNRLDIFFFINRLTNFSCGLDHTTQN